MLTLMGIYGITRKHNLSLFGLRTVLKLFMVFLSTAVQVQHDFSLLVWLSRITQCLTFLPLKSVGLVRINLMARSSGPSAKADLAICWHERPSGNIVPLKPETQLDVLVEVGHGWRGRGLGLFQGGCVGMGRRSSSSHTHQSYFHNSEKLPQNASFD